MAKSNFNSQITQKDVETFNRAIDEIQVWLDTAHNVVRKADRKTYENARQWLATMEASLDAAVDTSGALDKLADDAE